MSQSFSVNLPFSLDTKASSSPSSLFLSSQVTEVHNFTFPSIFFSNTFVQKWNMMKKQY